MQKHSTAKGRKGSTSTHGKSETAAALEALRTRLNIEVTEADQQAARQLSNLYHSKSIPPIIKHAVLQIFFDLSKLYDVNYPAHCTRKWLSIWPTFIAANRKQGSLPARITYTWEPDEEESARLDAEEEEENYARHVFELTTDERLSKDAREVIWQAVDDAIDKGKAGPMDNFEVFRVAWPLALANAASQPQDSEGEGGE